MIPSISYKNLFLLLFPIILFSQSKIILRVADWSDRDEGPLVQKALKEFEQRNPEISVFHEPNPSRQYEPKLLADLAAGTAPDVFLLDSKLIPSFTNKKILVDLSKYVQMLNIDTTQWFPNVLSIARRDGGLYAFPKGFTPIMIYYNKRVFKKNGIPFPSKNWNWDDFLAVAKRFTRDFDGDGTIDQFGTSFSNYYFYWIPWIWSGGGDVVDPTGSFASGYLNSQNTEKTLQFMIDWRTKYKVAPDVGTWAQAGRTGMVSALFINDKIAMTMDGHWRMPQYLRYIETGKLDIGVAPLPRHPSGNKVNVMYESGWCVPIGSEHKTEAVKLAAFLAGEVGCRYMASRQLEIPSVIKVAEEIVSRDLSGLEKAFLEEVSYCRQPWGAVIERFSDIERVLQDAVDGVMISGKPMHATMTEYAERIDGMLQNIRQNQTYEFKPIRSHSEIPFFLILVISILLLASSIMYIKAKGKERITTGKALGFLSPSLLHLSLFVFTPIVFSAYLSVHRWDIIVADKPFIGLSNFKELFSDRMFWNALSNTLIYTLNVPFSMAISLGVAVLMHKRLKLLGFLRTLYFLPSVTSVVAIALVWMWIYNPEFGVANFALKILGLPKLRWLNSPNSAMISVMLFTIWLGIGYQMVIFLAGLQGIPEELYDAAKIDGANPSQRFWRITFPLLKPTTFFIMVTSFISSFQVFTSIYIMTSGGPEGSTDVFVYHIFQSAWEQLRMGYASGMSWILFIIIMIATYIQFKIGGKEVSYQ